MKMNNQATPLNVLIFEYVTGGGFPTEKVPKSLENEGKMMVEALLENFMALPFINVNVLKKMTQSFLMTILKCKFKMLTQCG